MNPEKSVITDVIVKKEKNHEGKESSGGVLLG